MLPRADFEELITAANLGREGSRIAGLYYIEQLPQADIAAEVGLDRKTIGRRLAAARAKLESNYERLLKS